MYQYVARLYRRYLGLVGRRPWTLLFIIVAISGALSWVGASIKVRGDLEDLFPEDTPAVIRARETRKLLGNTLEMRIIIGSPERELNRELASNMVAFLESRKDDIDRVEFRRDISFFERNGLLFVSKDDLVELQTKVSEAIQKAVKKDLELDDFDIDDEEKPKAADTAKATDKEGSELPSVDEVKRKYKVEGFNEYFETPDGQAIAVKAYPKFRPTDSTRTTALNEAIEAEMTRLIAAHPGMDVSFTLDGDYNQVTKAAAQIVHDIAISGAWSLAGIALVVILFFRRLRALLVVVVILGLATAWMMAFAQVTIGYLNLVTSIILAILFGMGVDYVIHGMSRVDEEFHGQTTLPDAVERGLIGLARPVFNAMLTTAVTFFALIFFDFRGFSQLGIIAGFGVSFALVVFYLAYPPMILAFHRVWPQKPRKTPDFMKADEALATGSGGLENSPPVSLGKRRFAWGLIIAMLALAGGATYLAMNLPFDPNMGKFRAQDDAAVHSLKAKYREAENRSASPALVVTANLAETRRAHRYLDDHRADFPIIKDISSIYSFVPENQEEKLPIIAEIKRKIDNKYGALEGQAKKDADEIRKYLTPTAFGPNDLPDWVRAKFTDTEGNFGRYVVVYTTGAKSNALNSLETQRQIGHIEIPASADGPALSLDSSASFYISAEAYVIVKKEGPIAAIIGLLVVIIVVLFDFRRPRELLMICLPILSGFAITMGLLVLFDVPLDLFNVVVLPQIFGIGIDTGTHLTHRIKEGGPHVVHNVKATAVAAGISSLLTAIGFAALLPVQNKGLQAIGLLAVLGIGVAYIVNVLMFLAFQWLLRPKSADRPAA